MDKNNNNPQQNNSMFLYTALIFLVALVLIIIAFFGKINRPNHDTATPEPESSQATITEDIDRMKEDISALGTELKIYESLVRANSYTASEQYEEAAAELNGMNADSLTEEQKILYEQIINAINEGKEQ